MGYSTPKKQLDLKEFLSQPAKKPFKRKFGNRTMPVPADRLGSTGDESSEDLETKKSIGQ